MSNAQFLAGAVVFVGGWGFLLFGYPATVCRLLRKEPTPTRLRQMRIGGAVELAIVFTSALGIFIRGFFSN